MITKKEEQEIKELHQEGLRPYQISKKLNVKYGTVIYWIKRNERKDEITSLRERVVELESENTLENKIEDIERRIAQLDYPPSSIQQKFLAAKAKYYKSDEMFTDVLLEILSLSKSQ